MKFKHLIEIVVAVAVFINGTVYADVFGQSNTVIESTDSKAEVGDILDRVEDAMQKVKNLKVKSETTANTLGIKSTANAEMILDFEKEDAYVKFDVLGFETETYFVDDVTYIRDGLAHKNWSRMRTPGGFSDFTLNYSISAPGEGILEAVRNSDGSFTVRTKEAITLGQIKGIFPFEFHNLEYLNPNGWFRLPTVKSTFAMVVNGDMTIRSIEVTNSSTFGNNENDDRTYITYSDYNSENPVKLPEGMARR